jgi:competence protein ComEA
MKSLQRVWRSFTWGEQATLGICALLTIFSAGVEYSRYQSTPALPPLFEQPAGVQAKSQAEPDSAAKAAASTSTGGITVHVSGAVKYPGVRQLPIGARLLDAVHAAGGTSPRGDANAVNLAARLQDGQQVVIPARGETAATALSAALSDASAPGQEERRAVNAPAPGPTSGAAAAKINANTATVAQLESLPGIRPAIAARIVQYRRRRGRFGSLEDLDQVKGLGPRKLEELRDLVTF